MNYCNQSNEGLPFYLRRYRTLAIKLLKYVVMTKLIILITAFAFHVSAATYAQQITLNYKDAPLRDVLQSVRKQSGYNFMFATDYLSKAKPVTINLKQASIEKTLQTIFETQPFEYTIKGKMITIKPAEKKVIDKVMDFSSAITIRGKVVDENGNPLPGASVKAGAKVAITDSNGEFSLDDIDEGTVVEVSYIGYQSSSIKAGSGYLKIMLSVTTSDLNEIVINKGYYTTTKELNTGNVSMVLGKELARNPVADPLIALEGQVPGLSISQTSGIPGSLVKVQLRGQNSLRFDGNSPLYIVDGVPFPSASFTALTTLAGAAGDLSPFANLSLTDIDRIEVLKDADATAIYGSRGANGVILITTKKGKAGMTKVNIEVSSGIGKNSNTLDLMKTPQYLDMRRQALANDGITVPADNDNDLNGKWGDVNKYTDWQEVMIGGTANLTNALASVSGGNANTQFLFGGAYRKETTVFPGDYRDQKASTHLNINHLSENGKFNSNLSVSYLNDNNRIPSIDFTTRITLAPNAPLLYNPDGSLNWQNSTWSNPLWVTSQKATTSSDNFNTALSLGYTVVKGLSINLKSGYTDIKSNSSNINPFLNFNPAVIVNPNNRRNAFGSSKLKTWIAEPSINYNTMLGKGKIDALVGGTFQQTDQTSIYQLATGFSSPALINNIAAATTIIIGGYTDSRYRYNAIYARLGYNYDDQYLLNLTARRDASSRFGPGNQFGNFGAVGAAWIFTKQDAVARTLPLLSFGKLRASYGVTGNDQISDYKFLSTYSPVEYSYQGTAGLSPTSLTNTNYGWETVKKFEAGLDLGLLKDRISVDVSWYQNRTSNQLVGYALPDFTGFSSVVANLPAVIDNTGTEFNLTSNIIKGKNFSWTTRANLTVPNNKLVSYPNLENSSYSKVFVLGQPLSISFMYHYTGLDPVKNIYTFEDLNKDGQIIESTDRKPVFIGQNYFGGINNSLSYKGLQLDVFFQFVKQKGRSPLASLPPGVFGTQANQLRSVIENHNGSSKYQAFTQSGDSEATNAYLLYVQSDATIVDASFIRLKNASLAWNLPEKEVRKLKIQNARIYVQGQNLLTFTNYKGLDPELAASSSVTLPPLRLIIAGIQVTF